MFKKDHLFFGISLAIILPICVGLLLYGINEWYWNQNNDVLFKPNSLFMLALTSNLIPFLFYSSSSLYNNTTKGILITTMLGVVFYVFKFFIFKF